MKPATRYGRVVGAKALLRFGRRIHQELDAPIFALSRTWCDRRRSVAQMLCTVCGDLRRLKIVGGLLSVSIEMIGS